MPKTIDYPRTNYLSAWEAAEVVDDTGGKCSVDACARKLNRKVSGSFKAILGSAVKFGLLISKREMLTTTNLFRRIKNAYDKTEEKIYHREAFLHPPLFSHICRKFRNRELPVHMLDVMLVREFDVEEINAQNVAKAFVEGARMVDILDERNFIADIDLLAKASPRRELASPGMNVNLFRTEPDTSTSNNKSHPAETLESSPTAAPTINMPPFADDAIASLFGLAGSAQQSTAQVPLVPHLSGNSAASSSALPVPESAPPAYTPVIPAPEPGIPPQAVHVPSTSPITTGANDPGALYTIRITGPGLDTQLSVQEDADLLIVQALLEKIRKHLQRLV
ncbi:hypothetical protein [Hymenobacter jeollabukensis]|uniref:Uncharacterized protein n=1 Tax=Hymenobacter jeollabukensis TaxID=2025313 RepID=A0A5R8WP65_9BACT|nr:hypothetical protein [Hymenobacter jeollabukensis]TLM91670.1 hypothetical protein FDY95_13990 [Hymenobacter jeollabukensis]